MIGEISLNVVLLVHLKSVMALKSIFSILATIALVFVSIILLKIILTA